MLPEVPFNTFKIGNAVFRFNIARINLKYGEEISGEPNLKSFGSWVRKNQKKVECATKSIMAVAACATATSTSATGATAVVLWTACAVQAINDVTCWTNIWDNYTAHNSKKGVFTHLKSQILPFYEVILSNNEAFLPSNEVILPNKEAILPNNEVILPNNEAILPFNEVVLPNNEDDLPNNEDDLPNNETILPFNEDDYLLSRILIVNNKMVGV